MTTTLCTFGVAGVRYGVAVERVQEVLGIQAITPVPLARPSIAGLLHLRGQIVTLFDLRRCLGLAGAAAGPAMGVVVHTGGRAICLGVDELGDVIAIDRAGLEPVPATVPAGARRLLHGAYQRPDCLVLALDVERAIAPEKDP